MTEMYLTQFLKLTIMQFDQYDIATAKLIISNFKKKKNLEEIFYNLCFCILVPQTRFSTVLATIDVLKEKKFYEKLFHPEEIAELIKHVRFKNRKSIYLSDLDDKIKPFWTTLETLQQDKGSSRTKRSWMISNVRGMGMKSASHFLRNLGVEDLAIVDTHILKYFDIKDKKFNYLEVENRMRASARILGLTVAVLDALIWKYYSKTDWVNFVY
jgi:N-glycosylase/DNA lyase